MSDRTQQNLVQRSLSAHSVIGLVVGALLYLVCVTGTLVVFYEEWHRIEQPAAPEMSAIAPEAVQRAVDTILADERARGLEPTRHLYVHLPAEFLPRTTITTDHQAVLVNRSGEIVTTEDNGWSEFLLDLHYRLHLPSLFGLMLVGALGVMMLTLSLSGLFALPRIFRDAFRLRARGGGPVALVDWHNRIGVWLLPFAIAIALSGAMIGLAQINGYGLALGFYGGDLSKPLEPIFGAETERSDPAGPPPAAGRALHYMAKAHGDVHPYYIILDNPTQKGQHIQIIAEHPQRLIYGENYQFDAAGNFESTAGLADGEIGQQLAASTYHLHFGNYGGIAVKFLYFLFGLGLSVVSATGVYIWLCKRERRGIQAPRLRASWDAVVWGVPAMLAVTLAARFVLGNDAPFVAIFWLGLSALLAFALLTGRRLGPARRPLRYGLGTGLAIALLMAVMPLAMPV